MSLAGETASQLPVRELPMLGTLEVYMKMSKKMQRAPNETGVNQRGHPYATRGSGPNWLGPVSPPKNRHTIPKGRAMMAVVMSRTPSTEEPIGAMR